MNGLNFLGHRETPYSGRKQNERGHEKSESESSATKSPGEHHCSPPLNLRMIQICMLRDFREYYISDIKYETLTFLKKISIFTANVHLFKTSPTSFLLQCFLLFYFEFSSNIRTLKKSTESILSQ